MKQVCRHDAVRDTMWIGKGVKSPWLIAAGIVALAYVAVRLFGGYASFQSLMSAMGFARLAAASSPRPPA